MSSSPSAAGPPGVAVIGYAFMGKAHSHAWRNVAALRPGAPGVRQQVLVGRDADAVAAAAAQYGWAESATDWPALVAALDEVGYGGPLNIESFTADNASIATAASIWRPLAPTQDDLARDGLAFLRSLG